MNISENYINTNDPFISELYFKDAELIISVNQSFIRKDILAASPGKSIPVINRICNMVYFIYFMNMLDEYQIPNKVFEDNVSTNTSCLRAYKKLLYDCCIIDYTSHHGLEKDTHYYKGKKALSCTSGVSPYNFLIDFSRRIKGTSSQYTKVKYKLENTFITYLKSKAYTLFKETKEPVLGGGGGIGYKNTRTSITDWPVTSYLKNSTQKLNTRTSINNCDSKGYLVSLEFAKIFTSWYNKLSLKSNSNSISSIDFSEKKTKVFQETLCLFHKDDRRFYHPFHHLRRDYRKFVYFDNEPLVEKFDVHNCHYSLLNALIKNDNSIPQEEKDRFWKLTVEDGKLYDAFAEYIGNTTREEVKEKAFAKYLDFRNETMNRLRKNYENPNARKKEAEKFKLLIQLDIFCETVFPNIKNFIYYNKALDYKALHNILNDIETNIMVFGISRTLYEKYGIEALTLHDGIYVKESDAKRMNELGISTEEMFKEFLINYKK